MLNAVIIVLRETLEASLLVGFLFIYSNYFALTKKWMLRAALFGSLFSSLVASEMPSISDWLDGTGQELLFFLVLMMLSLLILSANLIYLLSCELKYSKRLLVLIYSSIIVLAISLEGAEIIIFFQSGLTNTRSFYPILIGSLLGLGIGISMGAASYYLLSQLSRFGPTICLILLSLVSAGMASQAISYMMQADLIESGYPVWNTSVIVDERSVAGHLLYALIGYEATPTLVEVIVYFGYIVIPLMVFIYVKRKLLKGKS